MQLDPLVVCLFFIFQDFSFLFFFLPTTVGAGAEGQRSTVTGWDPPG